jgi:chromosome segregation ATPase
MTIQYTMLVLLGFLLATLIALLLAPAFWNRAVRLTSDRVRRGLPASEAEIRADKDQLRAQYAMRVNRLEKKIEEAMLSTARQKIELNRRDAGIATLETQISRQRSALEEHENARTVLEQTVAERVPAIEAKLGEARKLLMLRDKEIAALNQAARRQHEAMEDARAINQRQASEIERLKSQVLAYDAQTRRGLRDADVEGELALRSELDALRARVRDQMELIDRLNSEVSQHRSNAAVPPLAIGTGLSDFASVEGEATALVAQLQAELQSVRAQLQEAKARPSSESDASSRPPPGPAEELRALKALTDEQESEIVQLRAELQTIAGAGEGSSRGMPSLRDNRVAMKARINGLEAKLAQQTTTIDRLRAELAAANERAARQGAQFMEEMRQLGVGTHATRGRSARNAERARLLSVASRTRAVLEAGDAPSAGGPDAAEANAVKPVAVAPAGDDLTTAVTEPAPVAATPLQPPSARRLVERLRGARKA